MDRTRWTWFAFGLVLGLVLGGSAVGIYYTVQLQKAAEREAEALRELDNAREGESAMREAAEQAGRDSEAAYKRAVQALKELEAPEKARKDP